MIVEAVETDGFILDFISDDWKSDIGVVEVAVCQNGMSPSSAANEMKTGKRFVHLALTQNGNFSTQSTSRSSATSICSRPAVRPIRHGVNFDRQCAFDTHPKQRLDSIVRRLVVQEEMTRRSAGEIGRDWSGSVLSTCREAKLPREGVDDRPSHLYGRPGAPNHPTFLGQSNGLILAARLYGALEIRGLLPRRSLAESEMCHRSPLDSSLSQQIIRVSNKNRHYNSEYMRGIGNECDSIRCSIVIKNLVIPFE